MTTIAYKGGVLAGDTRCSSNNFVDPGHVRKVFRLKSGILLGFAGDVAEFQRIMQEVKKDPNATVKRIAKSKLHALMVRPDGKVYELDDAGWVEADADFYAVGSGRTPALVAMSCGKSAAQAVKIAMEFDPGTGGKVQTVKLK